MYGYRTHVGCGEKMRPIPVALFHKRLSHNRKEIESYRKLLGKISFVRKATQRKRDEKRARKKKMVSSHALKSTFSLYSVLPPFRQPLAKAGS